MKFFLIGVAAASVRLAFNEFTARLPVDPHAPLLHTLSDLLRHQSPRQDLQLMTNLYHEFCSPENNNDLPWNILTRPGGYVAWEQELFCAKHRPDPGSNWLTDYFHLLLLDIKESSVTGFYATSSIRLLSSIIDAWYYQVLPKKDLELLLRLRRADWLIKQVRMMVCRRTLNQEVAEERTTIFIITFVLIMALLFLIFTFYYRFRREAAPF